MLLGASSPNKWRFHLHGGGWCSDEDECVEASKGQYGSSSDTYWPDSYTMYGFLSDNCTDNPEFCGWSIMVVIYCDGASFTGYV